MYKGSSCTPKKVLNMFRTLIKSSDYIANNSRYWDEPFLEKIYFTALIEINNPENFIGWLNFFAERVHEEKFCKNIFQREFPRLIDQYPFDEIFSALTMHSHWISILGKEWCIEVYEQYFNHAESAMDFLSLATFALERCKDEKMTIRAFKQAEKRCITFDEYSELSYLLIHDLNDDVWGFKILLKCSSMIQNTNEAGRVLSMASSFRENENGMFFADKDIRGSENFYAIIQNKVLNSTKEK